jgi:hypothetical protein
MKKILISFLFSSQIFALGAPCVPTKSADNKECKSLINVQCKLPDNSFVNGFVEPDLTPLEVKIKFEGEVRVQSEFNDSGEKLKSKLFEGSLTFPDLSDMDARLSEENLSKYFANCDGEGDSQYCHPNEGFAKDIAKKIPGYSDHKSQKLKIESMNFDLKTVVYKDCALLVPDRDLQGNPVRVASEDFGTCDWDKSYPVSFISVKECNAGKGSNLCMGNIRCKKGKRFEGAQVSLPVICNADISTGVAVCPKDATQCASEKLGGYNSYMASEREINSKSTTVPKNILHDIGAPK